MFPDIDDNEAKPFDAWCTTIWDLFVFKEEFLEYLQSKDNQMQANSRMAYWNFKLAWANYQRDVILPRLRERETEDD